MKPLVTIILNLIYALSTQGQSNFLNSVLKPTGDCKVVKTKIYSMETGFCSTTLHIDNDSTYTFESGCEGSSRVSIGKWTIINDSLFLQPFDQKNIRPFCKVEGHSSNDSLVTFIIKDKFGSSQNDVIKPVGRKMDIQDPLMLHLFAESWKDSLSIDTRDAKVLDFPRLFSLTGNNFALQTRELPAIVSITLNLNSAALMYDDIVYVYDKIPKAWRIKRKKIFSGKLVLKRK